VSSFSSTSTAFIASDEKQKILAEEEAALNQFKEQKGTWTLWSITGILFFVCYKVILSTFCLEPGVAVATNPFLSNTPPQQTSQNQQILDLFSGSSPAPSQPAGKQSALDDLLSLGLGGPSNGTNGTSNGSNMFGAPSAVPSSNPFADFTSPPQQQQKMGYGGNGFAPMGMGGMQMGMQQMGMGAPQQQFYQQAPTIQQPYGANNMNAVFGSNNDQGMSI